jgi:hypothetical protein
MLLLNFLLVAEATRAVQDVARMLILYRKTAERLKLKREEIRRKIEETKKKAAAEEERR